MMQITPEQNKINRNISSKLDVPIKEVEKALDLYFRGIQEVIKEGKEEIAIPYFGKLFPNKRHLKKTNEADNS